MQTLKMIQVDAFAERLFEGNPAAVVMLDRWLSDDVLQSIAEENNLSETAYLVPYGEDYELRWFTPRTEVELCGHATLASAFVVFTELRPGTERVVFHTRNAGELAVTRAGEQLNMDFPARRSERVTSGHEPIDVALGEAGVEHYRFRDDWMTVYPDARTISALRPDMRALASAARMVIVTAPGEGGTDFVSRVFVPAVGIDEDPVTGSAHCVLAPYWAARLNKNTLAARQLSARGGAIHCRVHGERVMLGGRAVLYARAEINHP